MHIEHDGEQVEVTAQHVHSGAMAHKEFQNGNNPPSFVSDEDTWHNAKEAALKTYDIGDDAFWPVVMSIYENMGGEITGKATKAQLREAGKKLATLRAGDPEQPNLIRAVGIYENATVRAYGTSEGVRKAWESRARGGEKPDHGYEQRERTVHFHKTQENEKAPLAERKEAESAVHEHMKSPESFAQRADWVLQGNYGRGAQQAAENAMASRGNREAQLTQITAHYEHNSPAKHTNSAWNKLSDSEKKSLSDHLSKVMAKHDAEVSGKIHKATTSDAAQLCRALSSSAQFDGSADARFMWMPAGKCKELHLTYDDKPATVYLDVMPGDEKIVQASFNELCTKHSPQKPFCDIEHKREDASAWPQSFEWAGNGDRDGIYVRAEWSGLGKKHVTEKIHRSFSPSFKTNAEWSWDKDSQRYYCKAGDRGSKENPARIIGVGFDIGTLTNQPAFRDMQPLFARLNESAAQPSGGIAAVEKESTMTEQEVAALKTAHNAALARAAAVEEQAVEAAITRAVGRNAIEAKDETLKASYKSIGQKDAKAAVAIIDALPAKNVPGVARATLTSEVKFGECSLADAFKGLESQRAPQNDLIRSGNVKEAAKLSRAAAAIYKNDIERKVNAGGDAYLPDVLRAADVTTNVDANVGTLSGLYLVLQRNLGFLKNQLSLLSDISTDFRNEPALYNQWVRTRYISVPTVYDYTAPTFSSTTPSSTETQKSTPSTTDVDVRIDKNKRVWIPFDTAVLAGTVRNLFQEQKSPMLYALGEQMLSDLVTTIISGSLQAGGTTRTFTTSAATLNLTDAKDVQTAFPAIGLKADIAKMPDTGSNRFLLVHPAYYRAFQSDKNYALIQAIANAQKANPLLMGNVENPYNFGVHWTQLMKDNSDYTAATTLGFCGSKESLILVGRVPQDYTQAVEAPPTATIQIVTEPETGLSIMVTQFVNNNLETANLRVGIMYGTAIGHPGIGFLVNQK